MQLTINTKKLQDMVAKASKGASNNKMLPLTSLMSIICENGKLSLVTTDATNYLYVRDDLVGDDFEVTIPVEQFAKLVGKLTCDDTKLTVTSSHLEVKGNGNYKIALPFDENGEPIKYPNPLKRFEDSNAPVYNRTSLSHATIKSILDTNRAALSNSLDIPCYTSYYAGENSVVTTDTYKICENNVKMFGTPILLSANTVALWDLAEDGLDVECKDNAVVFSSDEIEIYSTLAEGIEDFAIDAIKGLLDTEFPSECKIAKSELLGILDRVSIFVGPYDKNAVTMTFTGEGISFSSMSSSGVEVLSYGELKNFKPFSCSIDITMLQTQIKANTNSSIFLQFGLENAIKIKNGDITQIVALLEE